MEIWRSSPMPKDIIFFDGLATGTDYRVTLIVSGSVKASIQNVRAGAEKPTELSFYLRPANGSPDKHMVWIPDPPAGTHIGQAIGRKWMKMAVSSIPTTLMLS